jgi:hypothetical protein
MLQNISAKLLGKIVLIVSMVDLQIIPIIAEKCEKGVEWFSICLIAQIASGVILFYTPADKNVVTIDKSLVSDIANLKLSVDMLKSGRGRL